MKNEESARMEIRRLLDETSVETGADSSIRGDRNIINSRIVIKDRSAVTAMRNSRGEERRRELLEAVRAKAARLDVPDDQLCAIATRELRKSVVVLSVAQLKADDLARVYAALISLKRHTQRDNGSVR